MANLYVYEQGTTLDYKNENFIKQCKNTRDFSHEMNYTKILVSIQGNLYVDAE